MRAIVLAAITTIGLHTADVAARPAQPAQSRKVELISLSSPRSAPPAPAPTAAEASPALPGGIEDFRVHDLSRRWVEFQMAQNLTTGPGAPLPAAPSYGDMPQMDGDPGISGIAVPGWMRGAALFTGVASPFVPGCSAAGYRPTGFLRADTEYRRQSYYGLMSAIACEHGIPVGLFDAMIIRESRYQANIYSPKNAFGLTQLMPATAAGLGVDRYDIEQNLRGGARYLRQQLDRFGQFHLALAAYNAGPGRVRAGVVPRIPETQAYVEEILLNWSRLSGLHRVASIQSPGTPRPLAPKVEHGRNASVSTF